MIKLLFLRSLYADTYDAIERQMEGVTHADSVRQPPFGGNCINWILGHLVVARCNFLMMLDVPSLWDMDRCLPFIPGSAPVTGDDDAAPLGALLAGLDGTQTQLLNALSRLSSDDLCAVKGDKSIGEHLVFYHAHESYHLGQLEVLRQWADGLDEDDRL